ncbi:MAG TPA: polysaccharide deacetylase family protein [Gaiellaceae bacterium]|nr:polysaccharide deacetylase family protein [Gaiellaceae bacterium]
MYPAKAAYTRARSGLWLARSRGRIAGSGRILFYHRVSLGDDELAVAPARFRRQMDEIARHGLRAVDVGTLVDALAAGSVGGLVGLSFDDGYLDVADEAAPVLDAHGFSATVFVATAVTDGTERFSWYDEQPPLIPWDRIVALDGDSPLVFEAHTITHPNLLALDEDAAREEIAGSKEILEARLGRRVRGFCYPAGLFGERERRLAAEAGFEWATSCEPGTNDAGTDRHALRRIQIDHRDALLDFRAKLGGGHDAPPPLRALYRRARYAASSRS